MLVTVPVRPWWLEALDSTGLTNSEIYSRFVLVNTRSSDGFRTTDPTGDPPN
jgi:hypothetical protein